MRQNSINQKFVDKKVVLDRQHIKEDKQNELVQAKSYGDLLYEYCLFRNKLKQFMTKRLKERKVQRLVNLVSEVVRALTFREDMNVFEEFYHQYSYESFQRKLRSVMCLFVQEEML